RARDPAHPRSAGGVGPPRDRPEGHAELRADRGVEREAGPDDGDPVEHAGSADVVRREGARVPHGRAAAARDPRHGRLARPPPGPAGHPKQVTAESLMHRWLVLAAVVGCNGGGGNGNGSSSSSDAGCSQFSIAVTVYDSDGTTLRSDATVTNSHGSA